MSFFYREEVGGTHPTDNTHMSNPPLFNYNFSTDDVTLKQPEKARLWREKEFRLTSQCGELSMLSSRSS